MSIRKITFHPIPALQPAREPGGRPLVMIVDDSPTVRKIVEVSLHRAGYEVVSASDGVQALRFLLVALEGHRPDRAALVPGQEFTQLEGMRLPDLILLDIEMPRMDGYALALQIRKRTHLSPIPLVMLTRRDGIVDRLKARLAGVRGYLPKPFKEQDLRALVANCIGPAQDVPLPTCQPGQLSAG